MKTNTNDLIAAFLAKGGKVQTVAEGAGMGLTDRQWYRKGTDAGIAPRYTREQLSEQHTEQVREAALMGGVAAVNEVLGYD
jgi:hypothetical protein